jgi:hypothetical protein
VPRGLTRSQQKKRRDQARKKITAAFTKKVGQLRERVGKCYKDYEKELYANNLLERFRTRKSSLLTNKHSASSRKAKITRLLKAIEVRHAKEKAIAEVTARLHNEFSGFAIQLRTVLDGRSKGMQGDGEKKTITGDNFF